MKNYVCEPKLKYLRTIDLIFSLAAFALFLFVFSIHFPNRRAFFQLISTAILLIVIQLTNRFFLSKYRYALEDGYLLLSYRQGPREKNLGGIPITAEIMIFNRDTWKQEKHNYRASSRFSYCQNLFPENPYYLLAPEEKGGFLLLIFEPDETLLSLLQEQIQSLKGV